MKVLLLEAVSPQARRNRLAKVALRLRHYYHIHRDADKAQKRLGTDKPAGQFAGARKNAADRQITRFERVLSGGTKSGNLRHRPQSRYVKPAANKAHNVQWKGGKDHQSGWLRMHPAHGGLELGEIYRMHGNPTMKHHKLMFTGRLAKKGSHDGTRAVFKSMHDDSVWHIQPHAVTKDRS